MTRTRQRPTAPQPVVRVRVRPPVNPGSTAPARSRSRPAAPTTKQWRFTHERLRWALEDPKARLPDLGEVDTERHPRLWQGWPNGSCVNAAGGVRHLGRTIADPTKRGQYHALRWNKLRGIYQYVGCFKFDLLPAILK